MVGRARGKGIYCRLYKKRMVDYKFRRIEKDDLIFLNFIRNQYCEEFLHDSRKFTIEETIEWFNNTSPDYYIIEYNEEKIGYFRISNYSKENNNLYIGADIHPDFRGKGLAYKAYYIFIRNLFIERNLNKITLEVLSTNNIALSLYKKLGFNTEGIKREEILKKHGYVDSMVMSILRSEVKDI